MTAISLSHMCHEPSDFYCDGNSLFCKKQIEKKLKKHVCSIYNLFFSKKFPFVKFNLIFTKKRLHEPRPIAM
jgi:hypothetical protein